MSIPLTAPHVRWFVAGLSWLGLATVGWAQDGDAGDEAAQPEPPAAKQPADDPATPPAKANTDSKPDAKPADEAAAPKAESSPESAKKPTEKPAEAAAQETTGKPDESPAGDATEEAGSADSKTAASDPAAGKEAAGEMPSNANAEAAAAFAEKLADWKEILKKLRQLKSDYATALPDETEGIREEWDGLIQQGEALLGELTDLARKAYQAAPNEDDQLAEFLVQVVIDAAKRDDFEPAAKVARLLLDNDCSKADLHAPAATAFFASNEFELAEQQFEKAKDAGKTLDPQTQSYADAIDDYKKYWADEQALRQAEAEKDDLPRVKMSTSKGEIVIELFEDQAPETVGNFVSLVDDGFYNGLAFHRVLPGFMAQGGCPRGDGTGDAGYKIYCEVDREDSRNHFRGTLSMAHAGKNTGGTQFFITFLPTPHLNGKHTVFGRVIEGLDVLARLQRIDPSASGPKPVADRIESAEVLRKRDHEYQPTKVGSRE